MNDFVHGNCHRRWNITYDHLVFLSLFLLLDRICGKHWTRIPQFCHNRSIFDHYFLNILQVRSHFGKESRLLRIGLAQDFFLASLRSEWIQRLLDAELLICDEFVVLAQVFWMVALGREDHKHKCHLGCFLFLWNLCLDRNQDLDWGYWLRFKGQDCPWSFLGL